MKAGGYPMWLPVVPLQAGLPAVIRYFYQPFCSKPLQTACDTFSTSRK